MVFAVIGGDMRSVYLAEMLREAGHETRTFALEKAMSDCCGSAREASAGVDGVILPMPCEVGERLNSPLSGGEWCVFDILRQVPRGTAVFAGKAGDGVVEACKRLDMRLFDYLRREELALRNAELTAEGAVGLLLDSPEALAGSRVLISGFGRIGRALAAKLKALGAEVSVAARSPADRALAGCMGCRGLKITDCAGEWDAVVNTVPHVIFGRAEMDSFGGARLIELASPPYGFDMSAGYPVSLASGLPGKTSPKSAARAIMDTIFNILEE